MRPLTKPLKREIPHAVNRRHMTVEISADGLRLREKGKRHAYDLSWESIWWHAVRLAANANENRTPQGD